MTENNSKIKAENNSSVTIYNHSNINPSEPKEPKKNFQSAANIAGVVVSLAAVITLIYTIIDHNKAIPQENPTINDSNINKHKNIDTVKKHEGYDTTKNQKVKTNIPSPKLLPSSFAVVKIDNEIDHFDAELSKRVVDIFNQKNYKDIHVSSNPSSNYKNTVVGKLILSNIDSSKRTDFHTIYKYNFVLEIMFRDVGGHICDQRKYTTVLSLQESNPQNISKEQAIIDLLGKLAMEKDIPFCNK